ncbi:MAG: hypothetical protein QXW00_01760 [Candidatus Woesearchaeota archaeon]
MRKGQAAMEFLMTYGWAILVVLVAIAALAYFGVLSPGRFLPRTCTIGQGVSCEDFKITADGNATVIIRNGMGSAVTGVTVTISGNACTPTGITINDGATQEFTCSVTPGTAGSKYKGDIAFTYTQEGSSLSHTLKGTIASPYE